MFVDLVRFRLAIGRCCCPTFYLFTAFDCLFIAESPGNITELTANVGSLLPESRSSGKVSSSLKMLQWFRFTPFPIQSFK